MAFTEVDRLVFARLYHLAPGVLNALKIAKPETVIRWHRAGFRAYWRRRSGPRGGRPQTPLEIRRLIRDVSLANPLWGAPRIHGELLKHEIGQTTVAKYMAKERRPPSQGWRTFISNHAEGIAALDLFVVPTLSFRLLFGLLILRHDRREILWLGVTAHPTAEWIAQQVTEAIGWEKPPKYLLRDRDQAYGDAFMSRIRAMGIRDRPTAARSPWQNVYCERAIGSIRRDCLDHVIVLGERHLLHLLRCYASYYNRSRTHLSLNKDAPTRRPVHTLGSIEARPVLGGLHHHYFVFDFRQGQLRSYAKYYNQARTHLSLNKDAPVSRAIQTIGTHSAPANLGRIAPPICPDLVSDRDTQARLHHLGLHTIGDVANADPQFLSAKLGSAGVHFHTLAQAEDPRPVIGRRASKSVGSEHTLDKDVREKADIKPHLRRSADAIGRRLRKKSYVAFGVGIKLKTTDFQIITRQHRLSEPTDVAERLYSVSVDLLNHVDHPGPFHLVGMVAYDLVGNDDLGQLELFSTLPRQRRLEVAIDELAERFGTNVVHRANDLNKPAGMRLAATLDFLDDRILD